MIEKVEFTPLSDDQLRRSTYLTAMLALFLPPAIGATLMGVIGFYPFPQVYRIFLSYTGVYVAAVTLLTGYATRHLLLSLIRLTTLDTETANTNAQRIFKRLPWMLLGFVTVYSIFGALSADLAIEDMGYQDYSLLDHLRNLFGLIPTILITAFSIFF